MSFKAIKALLKMYSKENIEVLNCIGMLGIVYRYKGQWKKAKELEV